MAVKQKIRAESQVQLRRTSEQNSVVFTVNEQKRSRKKIVTATYPFVRIFKNNDGDQAVRIRVGKAKAKFIMVGKTFLPARHTHISREIQQVRDRLLEILKPDAAERWIYAPNPALAGISPRDAIEAGKLDVVLELIAQVAHGIHS